VKAEPAGLDDVFLVPLEWRADDRGAFSELFRGSWMPDAPPMVQVNMSRSRAGVLRGMHFHREQADFWVLLSGKQFVALYDLRPNSATTSRSLELSMDPSEQVRGLYVPPGVAHGFYAETEVELLYLVDRYYTGEDEYGFAWNDPAAGIRWPTADPVLSDRDLSNPPLAEVRIP
jgi:dTDP-4-dehydrorhamnose 3,5-epimerase